MPSSLLLKNAKVITMNSPRSATQPAAELVAIDGDTIFYVGKNSEAERLTGHDTKVIDCEGKTVMPGFNDAHVHTFSLVKKILSVDLTTVRSIEDIKKAVRKQAAKTPPGNWISCTDYNEFYLVGKTCPTRWDIDEVAPDHPVILSHRSLHACVLNSMALSLAGITKDTPEPPGGRIERDLETGEPNGILIDMISFIRSGVMPPLSEKELNRGLTRLNKLFLSNGLTSVQDATVRNGADRWQAICRFILDQKIRSRMTFMPGNEYWKEFQSMQMKTGAGDNLMQMGAVKFLVEVQHNQQILNEQVLECHKAGWQIALHAVAESSIETAVTALENAAKHSPTAGRRHRIEHCVECTPKLMERIKKLDLMIDTHPGNLYYSGERYLATVEKNQLPWLYRIKTPLAEGIKLAFASDAPVIPINPMIGIYGAVTRQAESGQVLLPEERITVAQALELYTHGGAYASFEDKIKGVLAPTMLADMIILSGDPLTVPPEKLKDIKVEKTIIGGEVVWER
jgi:predicted amidohydrolase YtcJ